MVEIRDMYKIYKMGDNEVRALNGVNLKIRPHEFVAIIGPSGSGKSTLMNMIGCLDTPTSGEYYIDGHEASTLKEDEQAAIRNKEIGFIFQQYNLLQKLSVEENVELPLIYAGVPAAKRKEMTKIALERVGLYDRRHHKPTELSGGQQQRASIARALAARPPIILADEPTGALDSKTGTEVLSMLKELHQEGKTVILITHDNRIAHEAERIVRIMDGEIVFDSLVDGDKSQVNV
ncbi:MAG: ABC transporter ATP-binding protein [Ruminococcaceae bacterium]|nr:ABC transporter ATP-binding protein [Oscillospiraceae bacterium]